QSVALGYSIPPLRGSRGRDLTPTSEDCTARSPRLLPPAARCGIDVGIPPACSRLPEAARAMLPALLLTAFAAAPDTPAREYHFVTAIIPLLSRFACNSSGCHGKAEGQNGFKLSVFGFDPQADFASLVKEGRGRRVLPSAPETSLLVKKMSGQSPHGGGARIRAGTREYATIVGWVAAGMPYGRDDAPHVVKVRVEPSERVLGMRET